MSEFVIDMEGAWVLTVDEIWPDGDAPENPTEADVVERIQRFSAHRLVADWNMEPRVTVNGVEAFRGS